MDNHRGVQSVIADRLGNVVTVEVQYCLFCFYEAEVKANGANI